MPPGFRPMRADGALNGPCSPNMSRESDLPECEMFLAFPSRPIPVRDALKSVMGAVSGLNLPPETSDSLQIALAELLNNVVEHAHGDRGEGRIELRLQADRRGLSCSVVDDGIEMPGGTLPAGCDDWSLDSLADLPEGGFGWYLIRQAVEELRYVRECGLNRVSFRLNFG